MPARSQFVFVSAKWSKDVGAYVGTIDGKVAIISIEGNDSKTAVKSTAIEASVPKAGKSRKRAKRLSPAETEQATALIAAGKTQVEIQKEIPGVVPNIFNRLKRQIAKLPAGKVAKKKQPAKAPVRKTASKKSVVAKA